MKKRILSIMIIITALLVPLALALIGFCAPAQFDETYYGELAYMYRRLKNTRGKKIVLIGNSALAFGVRTDLMEQEFPGYTVVNFGLYGAIGTKTMLDLSRGNIGEGDIVIVAPERNEQAQSLYFSAGETWMAADGDFSMLSGLKWENAGAMAGNFLGFLSQKYGFLRAGKPAVSGVYAQSSFNDGDGNETGYMTYRREYNSMAAGYDPNQPVDFSEEVSREFLDYLNEYNRFVTGKGAVLYYGFTPVNRLALKEGTEEGTLDSYYGELRHALGFRILGNPNRYVMDYEWFYDSNFHLNSAGMFVYTDRLTEDLKAELGIDTPNRIEIPEKPEGTAPSVPSEGENADEAYFTYEDFGEGYKITGMTEAGRGRASYVIPASHNGKAVICFNASVFAGNAAVREITLQESLRFLYDRSFEGCTSLRRLVLRHENPNTVGVGYSLLDGAEHCRIYVKADVYDIFSTHYNWGVYRDELVAYD